MAAAENLLMARLPRADRLRLSRLCTRVQWTLGDVLYQPGDATSHVYFPVDGFVSLVSVLEGHPGLEVGMVGCEGLLGVHQVLGVRRSPVRVVVQGGGSAWSLGALAMRREMEGGGALPRVLHQYICVLMSQLSTSAACLRFHLVGARLARWLLMTQDRAQADDFDVTQEFLAYMLGVRRVGVSAAAGALQRSGLIRYHRGRLTVVNRAGLMSAACSCYATDLASYGSVFPAGPLPLLQPRTSTRPQPAPKD